MFFRKICYHSYQTGKKDEHKLENPTMMKCCAARGKFEYVIEARLCAIPDGWFDAIKTSGSEEVPESQVP